MKLCLVLLLTLSGLLNAAEPFLEKQDLFTVGEDPAFKTYHIPGIVVTAKGTVLAWCEARRDGSDWDDIKILLRRSPDEGKTWSAPASIVDVPGPKTKNAFALKLKHTDPDTVTYNNPVLIAGSDGTIHMLFCLEYERAFYQRSDDDGKTWQAGEIAAPNTEEWINPNETVAVELKDGSVMLNVRSESKAHRRLVVTSPDGATNWSVPRFDEALLEPICMAGIVRYEHGGESALIFSNPHNLEGGRGGEPGPGKSRARKNLRIKLSRDEGLTWAIDKLLEDGPSAYSDLAVTKSGTILCFYGAGSRLHFAGSALRLARFNLEWLDAQVEE